MPYLRPAPLLLLFLACSAMAQDIPSAPHLDETDIGLTKAVDIAERHIEGKAVEASLGHGNSGPRYEVDVMKGEREYEVHIDARSGKVLGAAPDLFD
jgi:uncharacterized membrane protein YkoI